MTASTKPVVSFTTPQTPLFDSSTGQVSFTWLKWFQGIQQVINAAFDQQGDFNGNLGSDATISTREATILVILHNIDDTGVITAQGIDFSRNYINKNTDHIADGSGSPLAGGKEAYSVLIASAPSDGEFLEYNGSIWKPHVPIFEDIAGVAAVSQIPNLPESQIIGLTAELATKAPLDSPALTGTPTINGETPAVLNGAVTQVFISPVAGQAGVAVQRKTSGETSQMLGVVNETNTGWVASINGDGTITGKALTLTGPTTATSATTGSAAALPADPAGYLEISLSGTSYKIPYYNT